MWLGILILISIAAFFPAEPLQEVKDMAETKSIDSIVVNFLVNSVSFFILNFDVCTFLCCFTIFI